MVSEGDDRSDLDLAVLLLNSVDLLEDPSDRIAADLGWWRRALAHHGYDELATVQHDDDLRAVHALRATLRSVFESTDPAAARSVLNEALRRAAAVVQVTGDGLSAVTTRPGSELAARLLFAVAAHVADHGVGRLGTCASDPCRCAYVDRTRGGTRRYCCTLCNDRAAARSYRRRRLEGAGILADNGVVVPHDRRDPHEAPGKDRR